jgi:hypothetical protein
VQLVQVDVVGLQPAQRPLDGLADVTPRCPGPEVLAVHAAHVVAELGGEHDVVAPTAQHVAEQRFRAALVAVGVRGVEEGDPGVECGIDDRAGAGQVDA